MKLDGPCLVTETDLKFFPATSVFGGWLQRTLKTGELELAVRALTTSGYACDTQNALEMLSRVASRIGNGENAPRITLQDQRGRGIGHHWKIELCRVLGIPLNGDVLHRRLGVVSHELVGLALQGHYPGTFAEEPKGDAQTSLFGDDRVAPSTVPLPSEPSRAIDKGLWRDLSSFVRSLEHSVAAGGMLPRHYLVQPCQLAEITRLLSPIFGSAVGRFRPKEDDIDGQYLVLLALLSWAKAALISHARGKNPVYFREMPVFDWRFGVGGGFVDLVEVVSVNGKPLTRTQERTVRNLASANPRCSLGRLMLVLDSVLGGTTGIEILDLKFMVGDGTAGEHILDPVRIANKPVSSHVRQVDRYAQLAHVSRAWEEGRKIGETGRDSVGGAELVYFLPGQVLHRLEYTAKPEETREMLATMLPTARHNAQMRTMGNHLLRFAVDATAGRTRTHQVNVNHQGSLFASGNGNGGRPNGHPVVLQLADDFEDTPF